MLESLYIVKHKNRPVAGRQLFNRAFQVDSVHRAAEPQIGGADIFSWAASLLIGFRRFFQRSRRERLLAQTHQDHVDRHPVKPGREGRLATESSNLPKELK